MVEVFEKLVESLRAYQINQNNCDLLDRTTDDGKTSRWPQSDDSNVAHVLYKTHDARTSVSSLQTVLVPRATIDSAEMMA